MLRAGLTMPLTEYGIEVVVQRAWELHGSFTFADASYVAVAELTRTPFVTLDENLARGPQIRCDVILAPRSEE